MNCKGCRINGPDELIPALNDAFHQTVPVIIDCPVDYSENVKLTKLLKEIYSNPDI